MSLVDKFLKAHKGKNIFCGIAPTPGGNKAESEGILEEYDRSYVLLRCENSLILMRKSAIISYEMEYKNIGMVEIVP